MPQLFTLAEAAARARISTRTLDKRRRAGTGPAVTKIGNRTYISEHALVEWLDRLTEPARADVARPGVAG